MKLNTAKLMVLDPALYVGGEEAYANHYLMMRG